MMGIGRYGSIKAYILKYMSSLLSGKTHSYSSVFSWWVCQLLSVAAQPVLSLLDPSLCFWGGKPVNYISQTF